MINLEKALKFPFEQKNWETKLGLLFLFYLAVSLVTSMTNFNQPSSTEMFEEVFRSGNLNTFYTNPALSSLSVYNSIWLIILQFALIPVSLYLAGYEFSYTRNVMNKKKEALDEHGNIWGFVRLGLVKVLLGIPYSLVYGFAVAAFVITMVTFAGIPLGTNSEFAAVGIGLLILFTILLVAGLVLLSFINIAVYYNYLSGKGFWGSLGLRNVMSALRDGWKEFLAAFGFQLLVGFGAFIISVLLICFSFIAQPAITLYTQLVTAHLFGQAYQKLAEKK